MAWYLAPSLAQLRSEINARWPNRDHASDGSIGDAAHSATKSDHNPNSRGSVNAIDVDEDGPDFATVFAAIKRHPSARYVIYERRLYHRDRGWKPEPYSGDNPHDKHFHLSIDQTRTAEQDRRSWGLLTTTGGIMLPKQGDTGPDVGYWQRMLIAAGEKLPKYGVDEDYGDEMTAAVASWFKKNGNGTTYHGRSITSWIAINLQRQVFKGEKGDPGPAGKPGAPGKDGVLTLPMNATITGTITSA
jgi:hypothetical protein